MLTESCSRRVSCPEHPWQGSKGACGGFGARRHLEPLCQALPWGSHPPRSGGNPPPVPWSGGDPDVQAASHLRSWGRAACRMAPQFWAQPLTLPQAGSTRPPGSPQTGVCSGMVWLPWPYSKSPQTQLSAAMPSCFLGRRCRISPPSVKTCSFMQARANQHLGSCQPKHPPGTVGFAVSIFGLFPFPGIVSDRENQDKCPHALECWS